MRLLENERDNWSLARLYAPEPTNQDQEAHIREGLAWLVRAQDSGNDRGIAYGTPFGRDFDASYPETTGYICETFLEQARLRNDPSLRARAIEMGDWEIAIQLPDGAVMGGTFNHDPTPAVFNTGMVLLGWSALIRETGEERFRLAAERAGDWLVASQEENGHWIRGNSKFAVASATLYNVKAAWGLCAAGVALGNQRFIDAAVRNAEYCVSQQHNNGWFPNCCLTNPGAPLLHTLAYTMQGLIGIGRLTGRTDFVESARRLADLELCLMRTNGFLPGRQRADGTGAVDWCCLTGSAQTSIVWNTLYSLTGDARYRDAARVVNRYLMAHHDIRNDDPRLRGGLAGSWPVTAEYGRLYVLNWATKFLVDALSLQVQAGDEPLEFHAEQATDALLQTLELRFPSNPFFSPNFFHSQRALGFDAWIIGMRDSRGDYRHACGAFLRRGRFNCTLEIASLPAVSASHEFWSAFRRFCHEHQVTSVELNSYGTEARVEIPKLGRQQRWRERCEFVLALDSDVEQGLATNHRRNAKKAIKAQLTVTRSRDADDLLAHHALMHASLNRRRDRGETVALSEIDQHDETLLRTGAGELYQVRRDDIVLSSMLIVSGRSAAYYRSAGTSPEGMALGASHFLILSIAQQLRDEGVTLFNLGGADRESSLARFKEGFGAYEVSLSASSCYVGPTWKRWLTNGADVVRRNTAEISSNQAHRISTLLVYAAAPDIIAPPPADTGFELVELDHAVLEALDAGGENFRHRQLQRVSRFGASYAFAVRVNGEIANVSWLLPREAIVRDIPKILRPADGEYEITGAETLEPFRGRGIYEWAIHALMHKAASRGATRVYMKTADDNLVSQAGIVKAGLPLIGTARVVNVPHSARYFIIRSFH